MSLPLVFDLGLTFFVVVNLITSRLVRLDLKNRITNHEREKRVHESRIEYLRVRHRKNSVFLPSLFPWMEISICSSRCCDFKVTFV